MSFKIIVDSCCDLTGTMLKDPCFVKVPLTIRVENSSFVDDASLDRSDLLWAMKQSEDAPSTACPAPQSYLDAYQCGADDIYVVTLSALLSGSHNSAVQARVLLEEGGTGAQRPRVQLLLRLLWRGADGAEDPGAGVLRDALQEGGPGSGAVYLPDADPFSCWSPWRICGRTDG